MPSHSPDAIVIGAGIIGSSIAWKLARAGLRVTLLDAGQMGGEASWAGAGMLAPGGEVKVRDAWSDLALESLHMYPEYIAELEAATGVSIDYRRFGAVELAFDGEEWEILKNLAGAQREMGIPSTALDVAEIRARLPFLERQVAGALFYPEDAMVDPRDVMRALRVACCGLGVEIREGWRATAVHASPESVEIEGLGERLHGGAAILAAGAWTTEISVSGLVQPAQFPAAFPVRGHLLAYALAPDSLQPILRRGHTYLLQRAGGFTVAGTSSERVGFDRSIDPVIVEDIVARVCGLMPSLRDKRYTAAWVGFRPATDSPGPEIHRVPGSRLWLAYGHYRNGILLAPVTAGQIAREILANSTASPP
ncbi:MAG: Glycine oxidase ThiO [Bryobacterales bacterium]|nr:Glycine oxidase ThiO [Bryobacterales bacterium]